MGNCMVAGLRILGRFGYSTKSITFSTTAKGQFDEMGWLSEAEKSAFITSVIKQNLNALHSNSSSSVLGS